MNMRKRPRFELVDTDAGWHWVLVAPNGEVLCHSEKYPDKQSCLKGIASVKRNALVARIV